MLNKKFYLLALFALAVPLGAQSAVLIDGGRDWDLSSDGWTPNSGSNISYVIDDWGNSLNGSNGSVYTSNPNEPHGGQDYDAEAIYLELEGSTLFVAIKTGLAPNDPNWKAGDIFFDLNGDVANTTFNSISDDGSDGSYAANYHGVKEAVSGGDGYEYGLVTLDHNANGNYADGNTWATGGLYNIDRWNLGGVYESEDHPASGNQGSFINSNTVLYGDETGNTGKYVIEVAISLLDDTGNGYNSFGLSLLDSIKNGTDINVHWNPLCNNDWIQFTGTLAGGGSQVPEPMPLTLMAIGFIGMVARKRYIKV